MNSSGVGDSRSGSGNYGGCGSRGSEVGSGRGRGHGRGSRRPSGGAGSGSYTR